MPTYVETADDSNLTTAWANTSLFDKDMVAGATGGGNFTVSVPASATRSASWITITGKPNSDVWESGGTQTVELDVNMGDVDVDGRCRIVRLDVNGVILQSGAFTASQVIDADRTFSPVAPTWTGGEEACDNRLAIEFEFVNNASMSASLKFNVRVTTAEIITDIIEDAGTCSALTAVGRTFNIRHDIIQLVGRTFNLRHDLAGAVGRTFNIRHDIAILVEQTFNVRHDILTLVNRTFALRHDISQFVGRAFTLRHDIIQFVGRTWILSHDIQETSLAKYQEDPATITTEEWLKRIANETAEYNRLKRIEFVLVGKMSVVDPTTQDDNA